MADVTAQQLKQLPVKKKVTWSNVAVGAAVSLFEVTTLGQPFEVLKTQMAANRGQSLREAYANVVAKRGISGLWCVHRRRSISSAQAWIESAGAGAALLFTAAEIESRAVAAGLGTGSAGLLGGIGGGVAQAYLFMGFCTRMKTAEVTRSRKAAAGVDVKPLSTFGLFADILKREGLAGINKGVNAVAIRQASNWGSRMGIARVAETVIRNSKGIAKDKPLGTQDKIIASAVGGALGTWNHPIEVVRIEMQSMLKDPAKPSNLGTIGTMRYVYGQSGLRGLFRGVSPRVALSVWRTVCMVSLADLVKDHLAARKKAAAV